MKKIFKYLTACDFFILVLIIVFAISVMSLPDMGIIDPYKSVDGTYIENPTDGEKVQFSGQYVARTSSYDKNTLYTIPPVEYDILEVNGQSVFIIDENDNNLSGNIGKTVHVKGEFEDSLISTIPVSDDVYIDGYVFKADEIKVI